MTTLSYIIDLTVYASDDESNKYRFTETKYIPAQCTSTSPSSDRLYRGIKSASLRDLAIQNMQATLDTMRELKKRSAEEEAQEEAEEEAKKEAEDEEDEGEYIDPVIREAEDRAYAKKMKKVKHSWEKKDPQYLKHTITPQYAKQLKKEKKENKKRRKAQSSK